DRLAIGFLDQEYERHIFGGALVAAVAFSWFYPRRRAWSFALAFAASMAAAVAGEAIQIYLPHRNADPDDLVPALTGTLIALALLGACAALYGIARLILHVRRRAR